MTDTLTQYGGSNGEREKNCTTRSFKTCICLSPHIIRMITEEGEIGGTRSMHEEIEKKHKIFESEYLMGRKYITWETNV
jgi:hypothetical protein